MFVSLRYNYGQCMQQQQQQQQQCSADWTSSSYHRHCPVSTSSAYFDYCNAVLPACAWYQPGGNDTASALHGQDISWNYLPVSRVSTHENARIIRQSVCICRMMIETN